MWQPMPCTWLLLVLVVITALAPARGLAVRKPPRELLRRAAYPHFESIQTLWNDMDAFGHINNAMYYNYVDDAVNGHLARNGVPTAIQRFTSESSCRYLKQMAWPAPVNVGLRVRIGRSSAAYQLGLFEAEMEEASALATFTHVYVDARGKPCKIDEVVRAVLEPLVPLDDM